MIDLCINTLRKHKIFIEIPVFLIYFAFTFSDIVTINLIRYRTCVVVLSLNELDCALLGVHSTNKTLSFLERKVQPSAILVTSTISIIESLIPPLLCFFVGPWSNIYGRKPIMLYSTFALIIQYATMIFISAVPQMSPWYIILSQVLLCASGGLPALITVLFSYLTDTIMEPQRGMRIAFLEAIRSCGILVGVSTGIMTLSYSSYVTIYSISLVILLLAWAIIWFYVPESIQVIEVENKLHGFFDFGSLLNTTRTAFKPRESFNRVLLLSTISVIIFYIVGTSGNNSASFMYFQNQFHWNSVRISDYNIVINITTIIGGVICVYFLHKKLNCGEFIPIVAGTASLLIGSLVLAIATSTPIIHLGGCLQCFGPAVLSMAKLLISKLVPTNEVSTIFAVVASLETVSTLIGESVFAVIYNSTVSTNAAIYQFVICGLYLLQLVLVRNDIILCATRCWRGVFLGHNEGKKHFRP